MASERPNRLPILISCLALFVSLMSWWESHSSRLINEGTSKAILYFSSLKAVREATDVKFVFAVTNSGKAFAKNVKLLHWPAFIAVPPTMNTKEYRDFEPPQYVLDMQDIAPATTVTIESTVAIPKEEALPAKWAHAIILRTELSAARGVDSSGPVQRWLPRAEHRSAGIRAQRGIRDGAAAEALGSRIALRDAWPPHVAGNAVILSKQHGY